MKKISVLILAAALLSTTSCSLFTKTKTIKASDENPAEQTGNYETGNTAESAGEFVSDKHLDGEWAIYNVDNHDVDLYTLPVIQFETSSNKIYGNTGCNIINGVFHTTPQKELIFENMISTMKACEDEDVEAAVLKAINETKSYSLEKIDGINHMYLRDSRNRIVMKLKSHNLNILNGVWGIAEINEEKIHNPKAKLIIDIQEGKLHGNSGCNIINGRIQLDSKKNNSIQFERLISTRKACRDMQTETAMLVALEEVEYYKNHGNDKIEMFDNKGHKVLVLKREESGK